MASSNLNQLNFTKSVKKVVVEIWKHHVEIEVTQLFNVVIPTTWMEICVAPNTNAIKGGVLIGSTMNLGHGLRGVLKGRTLCRSSKLPTIITKGVGTPCMVFINMFMTIRVNKTRLTINELKRNISRTTYHTCRNLRSKKWPFYKVK